ncbi:MAG: hypothetical protein ABGX16_10595 [Pirellulales bacterium]
MTFIVKKNLIGIFAGTAIVALCGLSWACSVPVFRYALERWDADLYELILFHQGDLSTEHRALVDHLQTKGPASNANIRLRFVDINVEEPDVEEPGGESNADSYERVRALWKSQQASELPWLVVRSPATQMEIWSGNLKDSATETLFDSPVRQEITKRLLLGQTAVWVLLDGTSDEDLRTRNDEAFALLKQRLAEEQAQLKLPEIEEADIQNGLVDIDPDELRIEFSTLRLSREDAREKAFIQMLLATEDDLLEFQQPMAFPIFGRGRVLYALVGAGISVENIHAACAELTGPCTCQVKAQNIGADLLMSVAWDQLVKPTADEEKPLPPLTGLAGLGEPLGDEPEDNSASMSEKSDLVAENAPPSEMPVAESPLVGHQVSIDKPRVETGFSPLMTGLLVLLGLGVIGIAGASLLIVKR